MTLACKVKIMGKFTLSVVILLYCIENVPTSGSMHFIYLHKNNTNPV